MPAGGGAPQKCRRAVDETFLAPAISAAHQKTSQHLRVRSVQKTGASLAAHTRLSVAAKSVTSKGVKKPRVPMAKLTTGGSGSSATKREARCRTVPSPPNVIQRSTPAQRDTYSVQSS